MKRDYGPKPNAMRRRAGDNFVALLFVIGLPLAGAVFWLTAHFLVPQDSLSRFVPVDAVAYVHANGPDATDVLLSFSPSTPADIHPNEAATFALRTEDDKLTWGTLVAWDAVRPIRDEDRQLLAARGAAEVGKGVWLLGDDAVKMRSADAARAARTIKEDESRTRALSVVADIAAVQAYAEPALFGREPLPLLRLDDERPAVFGVTAGPNGIRVVVMPVDVAASYTFGYRPPQPAQVRPHRVATGTDVVIAEPAPSFDVASALFGEPIPASLRAEEALRPFSESRIETLISSAPDEGGTAVTLHFPDIPLREAERAFVRYIATVRPERRAFLMPDQDMGVEYIFDETATKFEPVDDPRLRFPAFAADAGVNLLYLSSDGDRGTFAASSLDSLVAAQGPDTSIPSCQPGSSRAVIFINDIAQFEKNNGMWKDFFAKFAIKTVVVNEYVDKSIIMCGYPYPSVDK